MIKVKRTERGWAGHFICANRCRFRRNTLLQCGDVEIVISSVGLMEAYSPTEKQIFEPIGAFDRYYETMAWHAKRDDTRYHDISVSDQIGFESEWEITEIDADDKANEMHEKVVKEITKRLLAGDKFEEYINERE